MKKILLLLMLVTMFGAGLFSQVRDAYFFVPESYINFGPIAPGGTDTEMVEVRNYGNSGGFLTSATIMSGPFTLGGMPTFPLYVNSGETYSFAVEFNPVSTGHFPGEMVITGDGGFSATITLNGICEGGGTAPNLVCSVGEMLFGSVSIGEELTLFFHVSNTGSGPGNLDSYIMSGSSAFSMVGSPPLPLTLNPGESSQFTVQFQPGVAGFVQGGINITGSHGYTHNIRLTGTGVESSPNFVCSTTFHNFGDVQVGEFDSLNVNISNDGGTSGEISLYEFTGSAAFIMLYPPTLPLMVSPGESVDFTVRFEPIIEGFAEGWLSFTGSGGFYHTVSLAGTGINTTVGEVTVTPDTLNFGILFYSTMDVKTAVVRNNSSAPITISDMTIEGSNYFYLWEGYSVSPYPDDRAGEERVYEPTVVNAGDTLAVDIAFFPKMTGSFNGTLLVTDSEGGVYSAELTGQCELYPAPHIEAAPNPVLHSQLEQSIGQNEVMIFNYGNNPLTFTVQIDSLPGWLSVGASSGSVPSLGSFSVPLIINTNGLSPNPLGTDYPNGYLFNLRVSTNDPDQPIYYIEVHLVVIPLPVFVDFVGDPLTGQAPLSVQFTDLSRLSMAGVAASITSWRWDFDNDGIIDSWAQNPLHTYLQPGVYTVKLTIMTNTGTLANRIKTDYITVTNSAPVIASPLPVINDMYEDTQWGPHPLQWDVSTPNGIFNDPDDDPLTFSAVNSANIFVNITGGTFRLTSTQDWYGTQTISITATDPFGESVTQSIVVTVIPVNDAPVLSLPADFYFIRNSHYTVDFGQYLNDPDNPLDEVSITITPSGAQNQISFAYQPINAPAVQGQHSVQFWAPTNWVGVGSFQFVANDHAGRAIATGSFRMTVLEHFTVNLAADAGTSSVAAVAFAGQTVHFRDNTLGNPDWWQWQIRRNGIVIQTSDMQNPVFTLNQPGNYGAMLVLGNTEALEQAQQNILQLFTLTGTAVDPDALEPEWTLDGSPYNIYGTISIPEDQTVEIEPGVEINIFNDDEPLDIFGVMLGHGVTFQPQTNSGFWSGMRIYGNPTREVCSFENCQIKDALLPIDIIDSSPLLSTMQIVLSDTTMIMDGAAVRIAGASSPDISNLIMQNYSTGIEIVGGDSGLRNTPTLTNIRIRNSSNASRTEGEETTGIKVSGETDAELTDVEIDNYDTGLKVENEESLNASTPTLTNIRVRNSSNASRSTQTGIRISGNVGLNATDIEIEDVTTGMKVIGGDVTQRETPTLTNIRIRNSSNASRTNSAGIILENLSSIQIDDLEAVGFDTGIKIMNEDYRVTSTPTLTNIRVRNSSNASRQESIGLDVSGEVKLELDDAEIDDYDYGIKYDTDGAYFANTPTLTNIRVRNSTNASRQNRIGVQLLGLQRITCDESEISGYEVGLEVLNPTQRTVSTPTLTNIRVRNSSNASRTENIGIYLAAGVLGRLQHCVVDTAGTGILIADGNRTELIDNTIRNCETGIRASGIIPPLPIKNQTFVLDYPYYIDNPELDFRALELSHPGPWLVRNNTMYGYPLGLKASAAVVGFTNNIIWTSPSPLANPFSIVNTALTQSHNDISWANGVYPGVGNMNANPIFIDPALDNFELHHNSPCIDAGNPLFSDTDGSVSDIGAFTYIHRASMVASARFVLTGTTVTFTNNSWGHDHPVSVTEWDLGDDDVIESQSRDWSYQFDTPGIYDLRLTMRSGTLEDTRLYRAIVLVQNEQLKSPEGLTILKNDSDIQLTWQAVTETIQEEPIVVNYYVIYQADQPSGFFDYLGFTENGITTYTETNGADAGRKFYLVIGFSGGRTDLMDYINQHQRIVIE